MGYRLNRPDEPIFMAVPKPMLTEFDIHYRLESCVLYGEACGLLELIELTELRVIKLLSY